MQVKTTITLPAELLQTVDEKSGDYGSRSRLIERALRTFLARYQTEAEEARDVAIIERHIDELNAEAEDALEYQVPL